MANLVGFRFKEMNRLYHFTNFDAALKIIESGKLRFSKPFNLNDIIESNRVLFQRIFSEEYIHKHNRLYAENQLRSFQQISFSQDVNNEERSVLGFDLHTMWGLYANKGYGVCLVFDKDKLNIPPNDYVNSVTYRDYVYQSYDFANKSKQGINAELRRNINNIFFTKRKEWENEQEYRIIRKVRNIQQDEYLDISDSLSFIIICKDESLSGLESVFDGLRYKEFSSLKKSYPILSYEYGLDGYTLFENNMEPIWAEHIGFFY